MTTEDITSYSSTLPPSAVTTTTITFTLALAPTNVVPVQALSLLYETVVVEHTCSLILLR